MLSCGYFVLMITTGYLFGCIKGFLTVILGADMGSHLILRRLRLRIPIQRLIKNESGRAILRVISGPRAFRVVLFTRLTSIPFGIQNAMFGISSINLRVYHTATFLGLLPAQMINVYLGSTLRSIHEVLSNHGTAITGYISFGVEVICRVALMCWVVHKARKELSQTLLTDISNDGKLIDIQM
ncbi:LOW QUALITY PROTEIN: protein maelstrom-like [Glossina fuscipes fuscipes]